MPLHRPMSLVKIVRAGANWLDLTILLLLCAPSFTILFLVGGTTLAPDPGTFTPLGAGGTSGLGLTATLLSMYVSRLVQGGSIPPRSNKSLVSPTNADRPPSANWKGKL